MSEQRPYHVIQFERIRPHPYDNRRYAYFRYHGRVAECVTDATWFESREHLERFIRIAHKAGVKLNTHAASSDWTWSLQPVDAILFPCLLAFGGCHYLRVQRPAFQPHNELPVKLY